MYRVSYLFYITILLYHCIINHSHIWNDGGLPVLHEELWERHVRQNMPTDGSGTEPPITSPSCDDLCYVWVPANNTCILKSVAQTIAVNQLRDNSTTPQVQVEALSVYLRSIGTLPTTTNTTGPLTPQEIDDLVGSLGNNVTLNESLIFITAQSTTSGNIGVRSVYNSTKDLVRTSATLDDPTITSAIVFNGQTIEGISSMRVLILDDPQGYRNLNLSVDQYLVSSVIIASVTKKDSQLSIDVSLYFQILNYTNLTKDGDYACAFLDTKTYKWSQSGCTPAVYNETYKRYECTCNHLTTFALIWLPKNIPVTKNLTAQDTASLVFLSLSIIAFILVIVHAVIIRLQNPVFHFKPVDLLPLISSASTTLLFIFFIALSMTMYTGTSCCTSASVLMFFVYFFLIFMFCVKTSVGFFNYLRFVYLFPEPSFRKLYILLLASFLISIGWTSLAAALNANQSFNVTQAYGNKLYWFSRDFIFYFMSIPVAIFLLLNIVVLILVAKRIIEHVRRATSQYGLYERRKRCVLVLLSSCVTQGIGWLFGPFISMVSSPGAADVLGWFFVIFNGLEGVWTFLLYMIIRSQRLEDSRQISARREHADRTISISDDHPSASFNPKKEKKVFDDLYDEQSVELGTSNLELTDE